MNGGKYNLAVAKSTFFVKNIYKSYFTKTEIYCIYLILVVYSVGKQLFGI